MNRSQKILEKIDKISKKSYLVTSYLISNGEREIIAKSFSPLSRKYGESHWEYYEGDKCLSKTSDSDAEKYNRELERRGYTIKRLGNDFS